tara:strand:- start:4863 stop:5276 length:414 start_codon:yes stop_codon:yes gene_type:complete
METKQISKLTIMLGMGGLNGAVAVAAIAGLFIKENALLIAILFMAGPGAIATAMLLSGNIQERMFVALFSGIIATSIVMFAAGFGPKMLPFVNLQVLSIVGGISVVIIGLMIAGIKLPDKLPFGIMALGILLAGVLK